MGFRLGRAFPAVCEGLEGPWGRDLGLAAVIHPARASADRQALDQRGGSGRVRILMPTIDQRGALGTLMKPRLLEIAF